MNNLCFACPKALEYVDAGYRFAYRELVEPKIVQKGQEIDYEKVLEAHRYWNPILEDQSDYLSSTLKKVRSFLSQHRNDKILFVDEDYIYIDEEKRAVKWKEFEG